MQHSKSVKMYIHHASSGPVQAVSSSGWGGEEGDVCCCHHIFAAEQQALQSLRATDRNDKLSRWWDVKIWWSDQVLTPREKTRSQCKKNIISQYQTSEVFLAPPLSFPMCCVPFNKHQCVLRPVDISVPAFCWAADAKLAGGGGSPPRHDFSGPAGGFAESQISSSGLLLVKHMFWMWFQKKHFLLIRLYRLNMCS